MGVVVVVSFVTGAIGCLRTEWERYRWKRNERQ